MTAPNLPPNIIGQGVIPAAEEADLLARGAKYAYYSEAVTPGHPPILNVFFREPQAWFDDWDAFTRKHGFSPLDALERAGASSPRPSDAQVETAPDVVPAV